LKNKKNKKNKKHQASSFKRRAGELARIEQQAASSLHNLRLYAVNTYHRHPQPPSKYIGKNRICQEKKINLFLYLSNCCHNYPICSYLMKGIYD